MSITAHCGSCGRKLVLSQLTRPGDGFRCPFCGVAFAPAYASVTPRLSSQVMATHSALISALAELQSMTDGRLQLDRATVLDPIADTLPQPRGSDLASHRPARWWARRHAAQPTRRAGPAEGS